MIGLSDHNFMEYVPLRQRCTCLVVLALCTTSVGETYTNAEHGFSFNPPIGWQPIDDAAVRALDDLIETRMPNRDFKYISALGPDPTQLQYPYVLIQITHASLRDATMQQVATAFDAKLLKEGIPTTEDPLKDLGFGINSLNAVVDAERLRVVTRITAEMMGGQGIEGVCYTLLGADEQIQANFYARTENFEQLLPTFAASADTMTLEPSRVFRPAMPRAASGAGGNKLGFLHWVLLALVCATISIAVILVLRAQRRTHGGDRRHPNQQA